MRLVMAAAREASTEFCLWHSLYSDNMDISDMKKKERERQVELQAQRDS